MLDVDLVNFVVLAAKFVRLLLDINKKLWILLEVNLFRIKHVLNQDARRDLSMILREYLVLRHPTGLTWEQVGEILGPDRRTIVVINRAKTVDAGDIGHSHLAGVDISALHEFLHEERSGLRCVDVRCAGVVGDGLPAIFVFLGI